MAALQNRVASEEELDYSYKVIDALVEGASKVEAYPLLARHYLEEIVKKLPDITEALMAIAIPEHRLKLAEMVRSIIRVLVISAKVKD